MSIDVGKIYNINCLKGIEQLEDNFVDLIITSPPYYNLREYSHWNTYENYIQSLDMWFSSLYRILKPGGHICWNIQENIPEPNKKGRHYYPLLADTIKIGIDKSLEWEKNIVWNKQNATQVLFGSFPYPPTPIFMDMVEYIIIFRKLGKLTFSKEQKEKCKLSKDEWFKITRNVWDISPESSKKIGHPAPFPIEIPHRLIKVMSVKDSVVLDPFMGSGTTAIACLKNDRINYIGFEQNKEYFDLSNNRIQKYTRKNYDIFSD